MNSKVSLKYIYQADLVFVQISSGVYQVAKDKQNYGYYGVGKYADALTVVTKMNDSNIKVAICDDSIAKVIETNFELEEEDIDA